MTPSPEPSYYQVEQLEDCCDGSVSGPHILIDLSGNSLLVNDTVAVDIGSGTKCYTIRGGINPIPAEIGDYVYINFGEENCAVCTLGFVCPTPTPTVTPTSTLTPTPTPTNNLNFVYLENCCNPGTFYAISYLDGQLGLIPDTGVWYVTGQTSLTNVCYTIIEEPESYVYVGPLTGTFYGTGEENNIPYDSGAIKYSDCETCGVVNSCKAQITPSPTPTNSVTPTRTPTPSVSPSRTPTRTPTPTVTRTPTRTPTPTVTPTKSSCPVSQYNHQVIACQVGAADCTKTTGFIKVNGVSVFSWSTAAVTQSGNIQINSGDVVQLQMVAIDNTPTCVNGGIPFSDVSGIIRIGGPTGTIIYNQNTCSPSCSGGSGILDTTFTATTCNYYFQLQSSCS